jgi:PKD repeat protein
VMGAKDRPGRIARRSPAAMAGLFALCAALMLGAGPAGAQEESPASQSSASSGAMKIPELPRVVLQALPGYGVAPLTVGFLVQNGNPESGPFVSYRWNFGDGNVSNLPPQALFHVYSKPGSYVITVTATTSDGYNASGFASVIVRPRGMQ